MRIEECSIASEHTHEQSFCVEASVPSRASLQPLCGLLDGEIEPQDSLPLDRHHLLLELFSLEMRNESVDEWLDFAVHHFRKLVDREADAMICYAILREVVGTNLLAAI